MTRLRWYGPGLMALLAWGALSFGAVYAWAYWPLYGGAAALGVWALVVTRAWRDPRIRWMAAALAGIVLVLAMQTILLPSWLIGRVSPGVDRFYRLFEVGYRPAAFHTLSLTPSATVVNLLGTVAFGLLLLGSARAVRSVTVDWLAGQIMGLGLGVATIGILQKALGRADHVLVYGFWQPQAGGNPFGPFINRNHFAGWMAMVLPLVAAYSFGLVQRSTRGEASGVSGWMRWGGSVEGNRYLLVSSSGLVMGGALVLTQSRSGMASLAVAFAVLGGFILGSVRGRWRVVAMTYLALLLVGAVTWAGADLVTARFGRAPAEIGGRLSAWRDTVRIVRDFPVFGAGVGAYGQAMLVYQTGSRELMYAEAHNDYLQLLAEGGVFLAGAGLTFLVVWAAGVRNRLRSGNDDVLTYWVRRGAIAGLAGAAAQSVVEFSLQMPGNAVLFVVLAAIALHRPRHTDAHRV
ncbi:MAG: O-antigen ligase family protein [Acidobacteriota bacterium]